MRINEIAYLDQLYETGQRADDMSERIAAQQKFTQAIFRLWPEISATFDDNDDGDHQAVEGPITADELRHISRKLSTYVDIYTGDKEARQMSRRCWEVAALLDTANAP